ncbi:hypothetical protein CQW23_29046 [Capsicum baccatum]|uniref:Uncharacterized protein n=1 Tax=Capsicum baccatum TaxID=33114 RepID=A0A2G2VID3_CAPBA|nr:hypothetical protein CQW23_29046 [Capsicum baccatum]
MLINRSQLLEESIEFIGDIDPTLLRGDLFMGIKNEETTELGLLKEWFSFVCWEIFNPECALFAASQMTIEGGSPRLSENEDSEERFEGHLDRTCTKDYWGNNQGTHKNNPCCTDLSWSMVAQRSNQTPKVVDDNQQGSKGRIYEVLQRKVCKDRDWIEQLCDR